MEGCEGQVVKETRTTRMAIALTSEGAQSTPFNGQGVNASAILCGRGVTGDGLAPVRAAGVVCVELRP